MWMDVFSRFYTSIFGISFGRNAFLNYNKFADEMRTCKYKNSTSTRKSVYFMVGSLWRYDRNLYNAWFDFNRQVLMFEMVRKSGWTFGADYKNFFPPSFWREVPLLLLWHMLLKCNFSHWRVVWRRNERIIAFSLRNDIKIDCSR